MSARQIANAALSILQAAVPSVECRLGPYQQITADRFAYLFHDGSSDYDKAGPGVIRRTHLFPVRLLLLATGDPGEVEDEFMDLHDVITSAFKVHHTMDGTVATAALTQHEDARGAAAFSAPYVEFGNAVYRQRWWHLRAEEQLTITLA